ncbi:MAG: elongation factor P, partial [Actinobacteria bacterium]|nr:elongation factor P [Actinomycetota bacterium]
MPAISTNELKNGVTLELDKGLFSIVEFQHVKPGKGGAFVRTKLRNMRTGAVIERTFNAGVRVEQAIIDRRDMQFLYKDGDDFVFMDTDSYEQINVKPAALGDAADYLVESATAQIALYNGEIVTVEIPASVELVIAQTEPGIQGDRVSGARKPATLQTGKIIQVPLFVNIGDKVTFANGGVTVKALGLTDKTNTNQPMTFTIVAKPSGTSVTVYPKPIAADDPALSALEKAYANIDTRILNAATMNRINIDANATPSIFFARD